MTNRRRPRPTWRLRGSFDCQHELGMLSWTDGVWTGPEELVAKTRIRQGVEMASGAVYSTADPTWGGVVAQLVAAVGKYPLLRDSDTVRLEPFLYPVEPDPDMDPVILADWEYGDRVTHPENFPVDLRYGTLDG